MDTIEFENEVVKIRFIETKGYVFTQWIKPPSPGQYRIALQKEYDIIEEKKAKYLIADIVSLVELSSVDLEWATAYVSPKLESLALRKIAVIVGKQIFTHLSKEAIKRLKEIQKYKVVLFSTIKEAEAWIKPRNNNERTKH